MEEVFLQITKAGLSPNQLYLLYSIRNKVSTVLINPHLELRSINQKFINPDGSINSTGLQLLDDMDSYITKKKDKANKDVLGANSDAMITKYVELFPKRKLPSGKLARSNKKNLETNFRWFFNNFDYDWETIFKATAAYVDEYEAKGYLYMQTSKYFICKSQSDKSKTSELADYCELISSGGELDTDSHFKEKVV